MPAVKLQWTVEENFSYNFKNILNLSQNNFQMPQLLNNFPLLGSFRPLLTSHPRVGRGPFPQRSAMTDSPSTEGGLPPKGFRMNSAPGLVRDITDPAKPSLILDTSAVARGRELKGSSDPQPSSTQVAPEAPLPSSRAPVSLRRPNHGW